MINVSVIVTTFNEEENLPRCLKSLRYFDEVIVVDSHSKDKTIFIASKLGARYETFQWKGGYPKKRQWCLDYIKIKHDYILFIDADEEMTPEVVAELIQLNYKKAGYFLRAKNCWKGKVLHHGLQNNKLVLLHKDKLEFPVVKDLGEFCMGEMEGHYQPVLKPKHKKESIGQIEHSIHHFSYSNEKSWQERHLRYAKWEVGMIGSGAYPVEDTKWREFLKQRFRKMPARGVIAFLHSYVLKKGFLDGRAGFEFARSRYRYYKMVSHFLNANTGQGIDAALDS